MFRKPRQKTRRTFYHSFRTTWALVGFAVLLAWQFPIVARAGGGSDPSGIALPRIIAHRGASAERPESTLSAIERAIELGAHAVEIDVRTSSDGVLFLLHDSTLDRTTNGTGRAGQRTMAELKELDAGGQFDEAYRGERIPTLAEALALCRGKIDVLLDLKEDGEEYAKAVASDVQTHGEPERTTVGVRSVEQARRFRVLLPRSPQLGFVPDPESVVPFLEGGVDMIRLWPKWLTAAAGPSLVERVRSRGAGLQLNGTVGTPQDVLPLVKHRPDAILIDDPATLKATLAAWQRHARQFERLSERVAWSSAVEVVPWLADRGAASFLNRDYSMLELPEPLRGQPRLMFAGGEGDRVELQFAKPAVVFAAFEYNRTEAWTFPDGRSPREFGWRLFKKGGYRGTSNGSVDGKPHYADVYCRSFRSGEELGGLPPWWLCLAIVEPETAAGVPGFSGAADPPAGEPYLYSRWATRLRPLHVPGFENAEQWTAWQRGMREEFRRRLVFAYDAPATFARAGEAVRRERFTQQEWHVLSGGKRLFRFFRLEPDGKPASAKARRPTIVCFMGHGKIRQVLEERDSYQHACAARFAERGYLVFAMENVGMEPDRDTHGELDRLLRLDGYSWYGLLFAHQQMLLDHVFADATVDAANVGVTGVSTGGLLALSAVAMDPHVAAASVQGIFGSMRISFIRDRDRHCACGAIAGLLPEFDLPELALLAAPRPLHISNASRDGFGPEEAERCVRQVSPAYVKAGGKAPLFTVPPGGHEYAFEPAVEFFESTIGRP